MSDAVTIYQEENGARILPLLLYPQKYLKDRVYLEVAKINWLASCAN